MPSEIMLMGLNRKTRSSRKIASVAQRRNRARFAAEARARSSKPRKRRRKSIARHARAAGHAVARRARRFARNPATLNVMTMLKTSAVAASGGVLLDVAYNYLPVPANLKTGPVQHLVKGAAAIGMAYLARKVVSRHVADQLAVGALTVTLYGALRAAANTAVPSLKLGMYDDLGLYDTAGVTSSSMPQGYGELGYTGAGMVSPGGLQIGDSGVGMYHDMVAAGF